MRNIIKFKFYKPRGNTSPIKPDSDTILSANLATTAYETKLFLILLVYDTRVYKLLG
jgi:hypothetical protein